MVGSLVERQARIDALKALAVDPILVHDRLIGLAERGMDQPATLSLYEISQVSYALRLMYHLKR